jgi:hypothetical protein
MIYLVNHCYRTLARIIHERRPKSDWILGNRSVRAIGQADKGVSGVVLLGWNRVKDLPSGER